MQSLGYPLLVFRCNAWDTPFWFSYPLLVFTCNPWNTPFWFYNKDNDTESGFLDPCRNCCEKLSPGATLEHFWAPGLFRPLWLHLLRSGTPAEPISKSGLLEPVGAFFGSQATPANVSTKMPLARFVCYDNNTFLNFINFSNFINCIT